MKHSLIVLAILYLFASPVMAQDADYNCNPYPNVPVNVTPVMGATTFDYATSISGLSVLEKSTPHFYERLLMGVTTFTPDIEITNYPREIKLPDGTSCVKIAKVEVKLGYSDVVVHVAREIPQGSCGFNEVVAHEQKHVMVNQQLFQQYTPLIQQKLNEYLRLNGLIQERNYGYAMTVLHDNMKKILNQILQGMSEEENNRQQQIDTQAEFQRMAQTCNGQLSQIARQFRMNGQ